MREFLFKIVRVVIAFAVVLVISVLVNTLMEMGLQDIDPYMEAMDTRTAYILTSGYAGMAVVMVANQIMVDVLGSDILRGKVFGIIKMVIYFAIWALCIVYTQVDVMRMLPEVVAEGSIFTNTLLLATFMGAPACAYVSYEASVEGYSTRHTLMLRSAKGYAISLVLALVIAVLVNFVPVVGEIVFYVAVVLSNAIVILYIIKSGRLPYSTEDYEY